jgi:penicillin-binding protein 1C
MWRLSRFKKVLKNKLLFYFLYPLLSIILIFYVVLLPRSIDPPYSKVIKFRNGNIARVYLADDEQWRINENFKNIPKMLKVCFIEKEDKYFYLHPGFNPVSLLKAAFRYVKYGKVINGGSTITMQIARILEPKKRTVLSKILEILRAIQYELRFSKRKIFEIYLNNAPFGRNIVGVESASLFYYGCSLDELELYQLATLASLPQSPGINYFNRRDLLLKKRNDLLNKLCKHRKISKDVLKRELANPIDITPHRFPKKIPHLSDYFILNGTKNEYITTVDADIQGYVSKKLYSYWEELRTKGISNGSVVLMDNKTGEVLAICGSIDYFRSKEGQVRGFMADRPPGSTLKPFLYGLAIEDGIITPKTILKDIPTNFKDFYPVNFDQKYRGMVRAEIALSNSYNVPFVRLLRSYGKNKFLKFLRDGGISNLKNNDYYGLSLILGACEVRLLEMTNLYRIFPNGGIYSPYKILMTKNNEGSKKILYEGTTWLVGNALSIRLNPDVPEEFCDKPFVNKLKWKTGTSQKYKDAWTFGYGNKYTLGVWVGNFDGKSSINLVGSEAAAPIFFDILGELESKYKVDDENLPEDLELIKVCPLSGRCLTENCKDFIYTYTLKENEFVKRCNIHKRYLIEKKSGYRITSFFKGMGELDSRVFVIYPWDVQGYLTENLSIHQNIPVIHPK